MERVNAGKMFHGLKFNINKKTHAKLVSMPGFEEQFVDGPDGGLSSKVYDRLLEKHIKPMFDVKPDVEKKKDVEEEVAVPGVDIRRIDSGSLGATSKAYYKRMVKYLEEHTGVWMTKGEMINKIAKDKDEKITLVNTSWDWHSDKSKNFKKIADDTKAGLMFKCVKKVWQVKYNVA